MQRQFYRFFQDYPGRRARAVCYRNAGFRLKGLFKVALCNMCAPPCKEISYGFLACGVCYHPLAKDLSNGLFCKIVLCGAQPADGYNNVCPAYCLFKCVCKAGGIISNRYTIVNIYSQSGELPA